MFILKRLWASVDIGGRISNIVNVIYFLWIPALTLGTIGLSILNGLPWSAWIVLATIVAAAASAIRYFWRKDRREREAITSNKMLIEQGPQDLRVEHRFDGDSGHAELVLRNMSIQDAFENVEVTLANFSIEGTRYIPIDVLSRLRARPKGLDSHSKCNTGMLRSCDGNTL